MGGSALGAAGAVVGSSSLGDVDVARQHAHLRWTLYGSRWWGTAVHPEAKLLLLAQAFETCGFGRVKIQTDEWPTVRARLLHRLAWSGDTDLTLNVAGTAGSRPATELRELSAQHRSPGQPIGWAP